MRFEYRFTGHMHTVLLGVLGLVSSGYTLPATNPWNLDGCPPLQGTFNTSIWDLYPESADWDPVHCKIYMGSYYNASVVVYDPYNHTSDVIAIPGITGNRDYTTTGIDYNGMDAMYFSATSYTAFLSTVTFGASPTNFTGPNSVIRYDTSENKVTWIADLVPIQNEIFQRTGKLVNGMQDTAEDEEGNAYGIVSFGGVIIKISPAGEPSIWYEPDNIDDTLRSGGIILVGGKIILNDGPSRNLITFDVNNSTPTAEYVPIQSFSANLTEGQDALLAPSKYGGRVILWSEDANGTHVLGSNDNWNTAEYIGLATMDPGWQELGAFATDTFEAGDSVFGVINLFQGAGPVEPREQFTFQDITEQVDGIVQAWDQASRGF